MNTERRQDYVNVEYKMGTMESNITVLTALCQKFDLTIDKIKDIAADTAKMVAVHDERIDSTESKLRQQMDNNEVKFTSITTEIGGVRKDIETIKKWMWTLQGGGVVLMAIFEIFFRH